MLAANNIQCVRIHMNALANIYYMPYNTSFYDKEVQRIIVCTDPRGEDITDGRLLTMDGGGLLPVTGTESMFITLKGTDNDYIMRDIPLSLFSSSNFTGLVETDRIIRWDSSYIKIKDTDITAYNGRTLLLYVIYGGFRRVREEYSLVKQVWIPADTYGQKLSDFIDGRPGLLKRVEVFHQSTLSRATFLTLNCRSGRTYNTVSASLMSRFQDHSKPRFLDAMNIADFDTDFGNSFVWSGKNGFYLTFHFGTR